jgi:predicted RNA binding protein YcfA (HicA-like mRNA interferase family)
MKLPRGVSADRLIEALRHLGYAVVRQKGSHVRMRHDGPPTHSVTIPQHRPLKIGTLHALLHEVAQQQSVSIEHIVRDL